MNPTAKNQDRVSDEQAARWAARLDGGSLSTQDRADLESWLADDPRHRALLTTYCQIDADLEETLPELLEAGAVELPAEVAPARPWPRRLGLVTGLLAVAAAGVVLLAVHPRTQNENVATAVAQRQTLTLVDGSQVELDARTSLQIELGSGLRKVRLAEGEAFFAVTKDPARPFVVETPAGSIRVKGTKFDTRTFDGRTLVVTVAEGVVQVSPTLAVGTPAPRLLHAGDQLRVSPDGVSVQHLAPQDLDNALAWRRGQVVFEGTPLSEALARFARYHGIGITASPAAAAQRIGGRFSIDDLNGFYTALEEVLPVRVSRGLNGTVRVDMRETNANPPQGD